MGWFDLTVPDAESLSEFYSAITGWQAQPHDMGEYSDYVMTTPQGDAVGGVCHARGENAGLPAQWLMYVTVTDLPSRLAAATARGGQIVQPARQMGSFGTIAIVQDPAGAVMALIEPPQSEAGDD